MRFSRLDQAGAGAQPAGRLKKPVAAAAAGARRNDEAAIKVEDLGQAASAMNSTNF